MNLPKKNFIFQMTLSAMFIALGMILPFFTGQIQQIGNMLLPMHIPVLLCGLICGWQYGLCVGVIIPLLRAVVFGMPVLFPNAVGMAFELGTYGLVIGILYANSKWKCMFSLYRSMIIAMLAGRAVWGIVQVGLLGIGESGFTMKLFLAGAFFNAIPGIILQLILIPAIMVVLGKTKLVPFHTKNRKKV